MIFSIFSSRRMKMSSMRGLHQPGDGALHRGHDEGQERAQQQHRDSTAAVSGSRRR